MSRTRSATSRSTGPPISGHLDAASPRGHEPALGRQQLVCCRAQSLRRARGRRDAGDGRPGPIWRVEDGCGTCPLPRSPPPTASTRSRPSAGRRCSPTIAPAVMASSGKSTYDYSRVRFPGSARWCRSLQSARIRDAGRRTRLTSAGAQNILVCRLSLAVPNFRKTNGYASQPLDGIWARSPYLHNGSVPTLRDLLEPPSSRPAIWFPRGGDVLDLARCRLPPGPNARPGGLFRYDTSLPGNGKRAHEGGLPRHCRRPTRTPSSNT